MLDRENPKPLYAQLEDIIREKIHSGEWKPHSAIPSENELTKIYGVSRMTARSVLTTLVKEALLYRIPGKGTFVHEPKITTKSSAHLGLKEQLEKMGYDTSTVVISMNQIQANEKIANKLKLDSNADVHALEILRLIQGVPFSLHYSYIPVNLCKNIDSNKLVYEQLSEILERESGLKPAKIVQTLEFIQTTAEQAKRLNFKTGWFALLLEEIVHAQDGSPFEYSKTYFRSDQIKLEFEFDYTSEI